MARIRSVHPGLFTDEAFMQASPLARLLLIGLWTEADDQGAFEWKPLTLKARILPVDTVDMPALLAELEALNFIRGYEHGGRRFGAVRNFRRYQRPKKPNATYFLPAELRTYVALNDGGVEQADNETATLPPPEEPEADKPPSVPNQFPTAGEKSPQMEDGGCRREDGGDSASLRSASARRGKRDVDRVETLCREAAGLQNEASPGLIDLSPILTLLDRGWSLETDILPVLKAMNARGKRGRTWGYYLAAIEENRTRNEQIGTKPPTLSADDGDRNRVRRFKETGFWMPEWDGKPGDPDCRVPPSILAEFGYGSPEKAAV